MKTTLKLALLAALSSSTLFAQNTAPVDCTKITPAIKEEISANPTRVLQILERAVRANPSCACEIVKAGIQETDADIKMIASIVEVMGAAVPDQLAVIAQCAIAVAPKSYDAVAAVVLKLDSAFDLTVLSPYDVLNLPKGENGDDSGNFGSGGGAFGGTASFGGPFQIPFVNPPAATSGALPPP